jgi:hypothetical protein
MSDLVERLRHRAEIERLRHALAVERGLLHGTDEEIERLRGLLREAESLVRGLRLYHGAANDYLLDRIDDALTTDQPKEEPR